MNRKPMPLRERAATAVRRDELHILALQCRGSDPQPREFMRACENLWLEGYRLGIRAGRATAK
jgi:hypothetical protein